MLLDTGSDPTLADAVAADVELGGESCEVRAVGLERGDLTDLVVCERLTAQLGVFVSEQFQQAAVREGVLGKQSDGVVASD